MSAALAGVSHAILFRQRAAFARRETIEKEQAAFELRAIRTVELEQAVAPSLVPILGGASSGASNIASATAGATPITSPIAPVARRIFPSLSSESPVPSSALPHSSSTRP